MIRKPLSERERGASSGLAIASAAGGQPRDPACRRRLRRPSLAAISRAAQVGPCSRIQEHSAIIADSNYLAGDVMAEHAADEAAVGAVLSASRSLIAVATRSLGAAAEETSIAQYRALVVLASRGPQRLVDLAAALDVAPSTAGRMCDRLVRKGLVRRHRARADRRSVLVSVTAAGREVVDQATARRRELIADVLRKLPADQQREVARALAAFAAAAGEVPDSQWPPAPVDDAPLAGAKGRS
jgi:DNA-binding MarR family transcriptional regulator